MLKIILRLCLIVSTLLLSACMPNIKSDTPTPANQTHSHSDISGAEALSGNWDGLIQTGLDFTYIRLELDKINSAANASEQSYSGTAYAQSFADYLAKRSLKNDIQAQSTPINIKFDTRTNTFSIQVERGARPRNQRMSTAFPIHELSGIYSQADRALAGLTGSRGFAGKSAVGGQYFLFTRPDQFDKVTDTLKPYVGNFISKKSGLFEMFTAPDKNAINKWAQQLYDEYPQMDLYNMAHGVFELYCIKLMRDDHFEKHFGTRFDELIKLKLDGFNSALNKLKSSRDRQERSTGVMERMFWVGPGDNSAKQSLFWVKAHRFFINWRKEQLARLGSMPISTGSQAYTDAFETEMKKYAETVFWPSEVKADTQALVALRGSIAKLRELEKEKLYVSYNKALLDDLAADIKSSTKNFEQMVELSKFDDRARNKLRQHGRELQGYTGPSSDTQQKAAEMISAAINPNIVAAAAEFAKKQRGASSINNNLSPIGNGPFSHLAKYITTENRRAIDQVFYGEAAKQGNSEGVSMLKQPQAPSSSRLEASAPDNATYNSNPRNSSSATPAAGDFFTSLGFLVGAFLANTGSTNQNKSEHGQGNSDNTKQCRDEVSARIFNCWSIQMACDVAGQCDFKWQCKNPSKSNAYEGKCGMSHHFAGRNEDRYCDPEVGKWFDSAEDVLVDSCQ